MIGLNRLRLPERRLKLMVLLFLLGVAAPLYILFDRVYAQLRLEALHQYRLQAEHAVGLVDDEITRLLTQEAKRPFADYGFFRVEEQKLLQTKEVALSPLSAFPVASSIPGLIGYFQISPEGVVSSPVLPDITPTQLQDATPPFSATEYSGRLMLKSRLEHILQAEQLPIRPTPSKREDAQAQAAPPRPRPDRLSSSVSALKGIGQAQEQARHGKQHGKRRPRGAGR